jgi:Dolichyl-phosphate-mannose-protein mannosyltransferase
LSYLLASPSRIDSTVLLGMEQEKNPWWHGRWFERASASLHSFRPRPHSVLLVGIVLASLVFRLYVSRRCSLWLDEAWTRHDASTPWGDLVRGPSREHPPLMYCLVRLAIDVFGTSETAIRSVSLLFGCVLLVAVYQLCLELEFHATAALVVVASLAVSPFFIRHATEARQYAMLPAFTTLAAIFTLRLLREPGSFTALVGFAASAAGAATTHYFGLAYACALLAAIGVGTVPSWRHHVLPPRIQVRSALVLGALLLVLGLVVLRAAMLARFYSSHTVGAKGRDLLGTILREFGFLEKRPRAAIGECFISAAGLCFVAWRLRGMARVLPLALAFLPCAVALLISSGHAVFPRYLAPSFVFYQLGVSAAFLGLWDWIRGEGAWRKPAHWVRSLVAAPVLLVPLGVRLSEYPTGFGAGHAYYAGLQAYLEGAPARDTALVVFPRFQGMFIMNVQYPITVPMLSLETFERKPGIKQYVIAEFEPSSQERDFEDLLVRHLHVSRRQWRATPVLRLGYTQFQPAVRAHLLRLDR